MEEKQIKKILNIFKEFTDKNCPKEEIRYVYYNNDRKELVATDTIRLLVAEVDLILDGNYFIDVNKKGSIFEDPEIKLIGSYNAYKEPRRMYPKYENVIPNKFERNEFGIKYTGLYIKDVVINVGALTGNEIIVAFKKSYDKLTDIDEQVKIYLDKDFPNSIPVLIEWNSNLTNSKWKFIFQPISQ